LRPYQCWARRGSYQALNALSGQDGFPFAHNEVGPFETTRVCEFQDIEVIVEVCGLLQGIDQSEWLRSRASRQQRL
jgi:hypothetical protein